MTDLLVTIILAVCPATGDLNTTDCHERIMNCAVKKDGNIDEESIKTCIEKYQERDRG